MKRYVAPFAPASTPQSPFAKCDAYRLLVRQIRAYARGETLGRSVLVAGHRGAGKSTVTLRAIEKVQREWESDSPFVERKALGETACAKPFPVLLHGPDLARVWAKMRTQAEEQHWACTTSLMDPLVKRRIIREKPLDNEDALRHVLQEFARALHRALAKEIADQFRLKLIERNEPDLELAQRVRLELDGFPTEGRLRQLWDAGGFLDSGLFPMRPLVPDDDHRAKAVGGASPDHGLKHSARDQALREIGAMYSIARVRQSLGDDAHGDQINPVAEGVKAQNGRGVINSYAPLISLVSGLSVAVLGYKGQNADAAASMLTGLITAAASYVFLHFSSSPSQAPTLLTQNHVASLNRALPTAILRVRDMGLAPVLVIDELDKIRSLKQFVKWLFCNDKSVLSEKMLSCFLVDREYAERFDQKVRNSPCSRQETFFSHRTRVYYQPSDLLALMRQTWAVAKGGADCWSQEAALRYALLVSGCHPGKLERVLETYNNKDGEFDLPRDARTRVGISIAILMQLAIELISERQLQREELRMRTDFAQTVFDLLYYAPRSWISEVKYPTASDSACAPESDDPLEPIGLSAAESLNVSRSALFTYLKARTHLDFDDAELANEARSLMRRLTELTAYLRNPESLFIDLESTEPRPGREYRDTRDLFQHGAYVPLERIQDRPGVYRWRFDQFGNPLTPFARMEANEADFVATFPNPPTSATFGEQIDFPDERQQQFLAKWAVAFNDALWEISNWYATGNPRESGPASFGLAELLIAVAPNDGHSWVAALDAARSVRARFQVDSSDVQLASIWNTTRDHCLALRQAFVQAVGDTDQTMPLLERLKAKLRAGSPPADGAVSIPGPGGEVVATLTSQALSSSPFRISIWLQAIRDLAAYQHRPKADGSDS